MENYTVQCSFIEPTGDILLEIQHESNCTFSKSEARVNRTHTSTMASMSAFYLSHPGKPASRNSLEAAFVHNALQIFPETEAGKKVQYALAYNLL